MKNLAIIGASYLQLPLIRKAKEMGYTTHVFAWAANDVGEKEADHFYPISIIEKDQILEKCREIGICGICSISSDLAIITVNYVAQNLNLTSNSWECTIKTTNKHLMRECFKENNDPSPKSVIVESFEDIRDQQFAFPVIVKPLDRSGSRGITKIESAEQLNDAIEKAKNEGFEKKALIEEFAEGQEYSIESISWKGQHNLLAVTKKYTTGSPNFIETAHLEPAPISDEQFEKIRSITYHALDSLGVEYGASHTEIKIHNDDIKIIEIGARMGGDLIGSTLVEQTTGFDFVKAVIEAAVGIEPQVRISKPSGNVAVIFILKQDDLKLYERIKADPDCEVLEYDIDYDNLTDGVTDSSNRHGYYVFRCNDSIKTYNYLDCQNED